MTTPNYPPLPDRIKASIIDAIVLISMIIGATYLFEAIKTTPDVARAIAFLFIFLLYEPIFVSSFGGTIGHMLLGLRVKREKDQSKNVFFPLAIVRFIIKALLGWISLITVTSNSKRNALHDMAVKSIVIFK
ncbi:MAG TPA: RDD family protein [Sunxiuqinia sp.]|nr:RDD family protein [Sunxiuqinia sp.]